MVLKKPFNICVFSSGGGGNFQSLLDHQPSIGYSITQLICDRECGAVERAHRHAVPVAVVTRGEDDQDSFFERIERHIPEDSDLLVLAGFMPILPKAFCSRWSGRIINTHPSLLPKYGGKGMYGVRVQEAVLANSETQAGCTVHFVTEVIDGGAIILQSSIEVRPHESAWDLGGRVFLEENKLLPQAIKKLMDTMLVK